MNGTLYCSPLAVVPAASAITPAAHASAVSRGFLAMQGTGLSSTDGLGEQLSMRERQMPIVITHNTEDHRNEGRERGKSVGAWSPEAVHAAPGGSAHATPSGFAVERPSGFAGERNSAIDGQMALNVLVAQGDQEIESLRKGQLATVIRRPRSRPRAGT